MGNTKIKNRKMPKNKEITYHSIQQPIQSDFFCQGPAMLDLVRHCRQWLLYFDMNPSGGGRRLSGRALLYIKGQINQYTRQAEFCFRERSLRTRLRFSALLSVAETFDFLRPCQPCLPGLGFFR